MPPRAPLLRTDRLLVALAAGALVAGTGSVLVAAPAVAGEVVPATVVAAAGCDGGGRDTVTVRRPGAVVTTLLDACGQPEGTVVDVRLAADGSVPPLVAVAGTRSADDAGVPPGVLLGGCAVLVLLAAGASVHAGRSRRAPD